MDTQNGDLVVVNGRVFTGDPTRPWAQAVACRDGRILAVGRDDEIAELMGAKSRTQTIDVGGRLVLPGFTDAHIHFLSYAMRRREVSLVGARSLDEVRRRVRQAMQQVRHGDWLQGWGWDESSWDAPPHRVLLDDIAPETPVVLKRVDLHSIWVNSATLRLAGIAYDTPDPEWGRIERDPAGEPVGILREWGAIDLIEALIPKPDEAMLDAWLPDAIAEAHRLGITGIHDQRVQREGDVSLRAFQRLRERGKLDLRVHFNLAAEHLPLARDLGLRSGFGDDRLWLGHVKLFADGSMGSATALMLEPYEGQPENRGIAAVPADTVREMIAACEAAGFSLAVHAIGDKAVRDVLDAFEAAVPATRQHPPCTMPHRIEHVQLLHPSDVPRLRRYGIAASMQPVHLMMDRRVADRVWGGRARYAYALRSLLDAGTEMAFGSDAPVAPLSPLIGIFAAVARRDDDGEPADGWYPEERVTVEEAIRGYTSGPARVAGKWRAGGSLAPGKWADMIVLSDDICTVDPSAFPDVSVRLTVFGGKVVYAEGGC